MYLILIDAVYPVIYGCRMKNTAKRYGSDIYKFVLEFLYGRRFFALAEVMLPYR